MYLAFNYFLVSPRKHKSHWLCLIILSYCYTEVALIFYLCGKFLRLQASCAIWGFVTLKKDFTKLQNSSNDRRIGGNFPGIEDEFAEPRENMTALQLESYL